MYVCPIELSADIFTKRHVERVDRPSEEVHLLHGSRYT